MANEDFNFTFRIKDLISKDIARIDKGFMGLDEGLAGLKKDTGGFSNSVIDLLRNYAKVEGATHAKGILGAMFYGTLDKIGFGKESKLALSFLEDIDTVLKGKFKTTLTQLLRVFAGSGGKNGFAAVLGTLGAGFTKASLIGAMPELFHAALEQASLLNDNLLHMSITSSLSGTEMNKLGDEMTKTMLRTSSSLQEVSDVYHKLGKEKLLNEPDVRKLADAILMMGQAWDVDTSAVTELASISKKLYGMSGEGLAKLGSAIDYLGSTTRLSHAEIISIMSDLDPIMKRVPSTLRKEIAPQIMAQVASISAAWKDVFGDPRVLQEQLHAMMNPLSKEGAQLSSMIVALGGMTSQKLQEALKKGDVANVYEGMVAAIQNLKKEVGAETFLRNIDVFAKQLNMQADDVIRMSEMSLDALHKQNEAVAKAAQSTEGLRKSWDRFTSLWDVFKQKLANVKDAIFATLGRPFTHILTMVSSGLDKILKLWDALDNSVGDTAAWVVSWGVFAGAIYGTIVGIKSAMGFILGIFGTSLIPFILGTAKVIGAVLLPFLGAAALVLAKIALVVAAVVAVSVVLKKTWDAVSDAVLPAFGKIWDLALKIGKTFGTLVLLLSPMAIPFIAAYVAVKALYEQWGAFYEEFKPGIEAVEMAWWDVVVAIHDAANEISAAFGTDTQDEVSGFGDIISGILRSVAQTFGWIARGIAGVIALLGYILVPTIRIFGKVLSSVFYVWSSIFNARPVKFFIGLMKEIGSLIVDVLLSPFKSVSDVVTFIFDTISSVFSLMNKMKNISFFGFQPFKNIGEPEKKADGGVVTKPTNIIAGEAGPEAIVPLNKFGQVAAQVGMVPQGQGPSNAGMDEVIAAIKHLENTILRVSGRGGAVALARTGGF